MARFHLKPPRSILYLRGPSLPGISSWGISVMSGSATDKRTTVRHRPRLLAASLVTLSLLGLSLAACTSPAPDKIAAGERDIDPTDVIGLHQHGRAAANRGDYAKAAHYYEMASEADPTDFIDAYLWGSMLQVAGGDPATIERAYRNAIARNLTDLRARIALAQFLEQQGRYDDALMEANHALTVNASSDDAMRAKAMILSDLHRLDEAIPLQRTVIERNPKVANDYCQLAYFQERGGNMDQAEATLNTALEIDPKADTAYTMLGDIKAGQHNLPQAIDNYRKAIALGRQEPLVFETLAKALRATGQDDEAAKVEAELAKLNKAPQ